MNTLEDTNLSESLPSKLNKYYHYLTALIEKIIYSDAGKIKTYVDKLREQNPGISNDDLAKKIAKRKSRKCGVIGAITGVGGFTIAPVMIGANLTTVWRQQAAMIMAIAYIYGHAINTEDIKTDIYIVMVGNAASWGLKRAGVEIAQAVTKSAVQKYVTREVMVKIWSVLGRQIITRAGTKSLTSFIKLVPVVGAVPGYLIDWGYTKFVGSKAIEYYSGKE
ncbi:MAG: EcsC family protein [Planctomycetota bacterium]